MVVSDQSSLQSLLDIITDRIYSQVKVVCYLLHGITSGLANGIYRSPSL